MSVGGGVAPPDPVDPMKAAQAQTGTNIATAIAATNLGQVDQEGPGSSLTYEKTGDIQYTDPYTGKSYNIPKTKAVTTLKGDEKAIYDAQGGARRDMASAAQSQAGNMRNYLNENGIVRTPDYERVSNAAPAFSNMRGNEGEITRSYGIDDFGDHRDKTEDALMARSGKYLARDKENLEARLAEQGITQGSEAYAREMETHGERVNDARIGAILGAGQEQSRLMNLKANQAQFENQAQAQDYGQDAQRTGFNNAVSADHVDARYRAANMENDLRDRTMRNDITARNQGINEATSLLGGMHVPGYQIASPSGIATTDVAGLMQQNYNQQYNQYADAQSRRNGLLGGMMGLGSSLIGLSDRRVKKSIHKIGFNGLNVYSYQYIWEPITAPLRLGYMAQEVLAKVPDAVRKVCGVLALDYSKLPEVKV